eukprot:14317915-Alexandrium_andersonii.AAC.1
MLRRTEASSGGSVSRPCRLGQSIRPRMAVLDVLLLGSREDRDHGSVASGIEDCDGLEDEVRGE